MTDRPSTPVQVNIGIGGDVWAGWLRHGIGFAAGGLASAHHDRLTLGASALAIAAVLAWSALSKPRKP